MSEITIDSELITREYEAREWNMSIVFLSADPILAVLEAFEAENIRPEVLLDGIAFERLWGTSVEPLVFVESLAEIARGAGLTGRFTIRASRDPYGNSAQPPGFGANLDLVGALSEGPVNTRTMSRFRPTAEGSRAVFDFALKWCSVGDERLWFGSDIRFDEVPDREAWKHLFTLTEERSQNRRLIARQGLESIDEIRVVTFGLDGHVTFELAGWAIPGAMRVVEELTRILTELSEHLDYGWIARHRVGNYMSHKDEWEPWVDGHESGGLDSTWRGQENGKLSAAHGVQLLGPSYEAMVSDDTWTVEEVNGGRLLVSHTDPEAWFEQPPTYEFLRAGRKALGSILKDPDWDPPRAEVRPVPLSHAKVDQLKAWQESAMSDEGDVFATIQMLRQAQRVEKSWHGKLRKQLGDSTELAVYDRCVQEDDGHGARVWGARAINVRFPLGQDGLVVDPFIFAPWPANSSSVDSVDTSIFVKTSQIEQATTALARCEARILVVSDAGREYASQDEMLDDLEAHGGMSPYCPSYVSDPVLAEGGVGITMDAEGSATGPFIVKVIEIVREELARAGVEWAFITSDPERR